MQSLQLSLRAVQFYREIKHFRRRGGQADSLRAVQFYREIKRWLKARTQRLPFESSAVL